MPTTDTQPLDMASVARAIYAKSADLLLARRHAEELLANVAEGVLAVDKNYKITIFNHTIEKMLDIPESDAIGKNLTDILKIQTQKGEPIDLIPHLFQPDSDENDVKDAMLKTQDKEFFVNIKFSVIEPEIDDESPNCLITVADITQEILLDKAKDDFISLASHELRTPMTIIKSYLWMLKNTHPEKLDNQQKEYLEKLVKSSEELIVLINDMLDISRMEQGKIKFDVKDTKIKEILDDILNGFEVRAKEKNIELKKQYDFLDPELTVLGDSGKLKQVLTNIVGNAVKFTQTGSITVKAEIENKFMKISVIDTGAGITEEEGKNLFKKFGRGDSSYSRIAETGGTGLGLYICKMYVEAMAGQIGFSSEGEMKGSTFWFTIPVDKDAVKIDSIIN